MEVNMVLETENWTHNKTGNAYQKLFEAIDCTNERDGINVVVYYRDGKFFVREKQEFLEKFTK